MSEMTTSDFALMSAANANGGFGNNGFSGMWNNPFMYLIWLSMFNGGVNGNAQAVGRAELADGLNNQTVLNDLRNIETGIQNGTASINQSLCSGFSGVNANINNSTNTVTSAINNSTFANTQAIHDLQYADQMGFCNVNNNIGSLKYEMADNTCKITTAIHGEGEATRALITANQMQDLRDKIAEKDNLLQSAQLTLSNAQQTQNILNAMGRFVPYQGQALCPVTSGWN